MPAVIGTESAPLTRSRLARPGAETPPVNGEMWRAAPSCSRGSTTVALFRPALLLAAWIAVSAAFAGCMAPFEKGITSRDELKGKPRDSTGLGLLQPDDTWCSLLPEFEKCEHLQISPLRDSSGRFSEVAISDASMEQVARMPSLAYIHVEYTTSITTKGWSSLAKSPTLETISIGPCKHLTDADIEELANTPNLRDIYIVDCLAVSDAGIRRLAHAPQLKCIILSKLPLLTSDGLSWLDSRSPPVLLQIRDCPNVPNMRVWVGKDK